MKKRLSFIIAVVMMISMLAGCGSKAEKNNSNDNAAKNETKPTEVVKAADPREKYDETITLTSFFQIAPTIADIFNVDDLNNSYYVKKQEEVTNIHINYLWYANETADDSDQKKSVAIASGEIPDFMLVNKSQLALLAKTNLINKNIGDIFNQYASDELMAWTTGEGNAALDSASYKGQVIAIPLVDSSIDGAPFIWIRNDWLINLGLDIPTTMDELYNVMIAFRDNDPDGNGKNDTVGMTLHKNFLTMATGDALGMFNGFGAYPGAWVDDGTGKLTYGSTMPEVKEALAFMAKLFAEGLVEEDFSSKDDFKASEASVSGKSGIQYGATWNAIWPLSGTLENNPDADWIPIAIVSSSDEPAHPQIALRVNAYVVVSAKCEHPEAVIKLLNFWVDSFGYSSEEEYNKFLTPDSSGFMTFPQHNVMLKTWSPLKNLESYYNCKEALKSGDTSALNAEQLGYYNDIIAYRNGDLSFSGSAKTFEAENSSYAVMDYYYTNDLFMMNQFNGASTDSMTQKMSIIEDKVMEYYTRVIMGIKDIDSFDSFVDEVNKLGLTDIAKEVNDWYISK